MSKRCRGKSVMIVRSKFRWRKGLYHIVSYSRCLVFLEVRFNNISRNLDKTLFSLIYYRLYREQISKLIGHVSLARIPNSWKIVNKNLGSEQLIFESAKFESISTEGFYLRRYRFRNLRAIFQTVSSQHQLEDPRGTR